MTSNDEIYLSYLCDQIVVACNRLHKKLDKYDEFFSSYTPPANSYHEQPSWHVATDVVQPRPPPDPPNGQPWNYVQPGYQHYNHHQQLIAAYGQPPYPSFDSGVNNNCWPPPLTAHASEMQLEPSHIYPLPPPAQMPEPYHHYPSLTPELDNPYSHFQPSEELYPPVFNGEGYSSNSTIASSTLPQPISHSLHLMDYTSLPQFAGSETLGQPRTFHAGYQHGQQLYSHQFSATSAVDQLFYTTSDAVASPLHEPDRRIGVFAEMESHLAITDRRVASLRPPDLPEPEPLNAPLVWQQPTSGLLSGFNLPPQHSPSCWSSTSLTSLCRSAVPLPAAAAAALRSPDIIGDEVELLDNDRPPPTLSCSPDIRYDSMELIVDDDSDESVKSCSSNTIDGVKAIVIYCPRRPRMHVILGIHKVDEGAIDASLVHLLIWFDIGFIECRKVGETSLENITSLSTSRVSANQRFCTFDPGGSTSQHFARDGKKIEAFIESKTEDPKIGSDFFVTIGIMSANAKMCERRAWKPCASANFFYLSLFESISLKGWDLDDMLSVLIPLVLVSHDDLVVSLSFIGGLSTNLWQIPSINFWVASVLVGILLGKSWFTYATSIEKGIDESFVVHGGLLVVMVQPVIPKVDEELLQSLVVVAFNAFCVVVRSTSPAHVAANFLYECGFSQQISKLQSPISGFLLHIHRNCARVNDCNRFHVVAAAGANLKYNALKGEIGYKVHDPGLAMATMENVEQQWSKLANSLFVGKNDSENQMVTTSMFFTQDDKVKAPLVDFLGRISEFGVLARDL